MSQIGSFPQIEVKIKNLWNHQLDHNHWFFRPDFSVWFDVHPFFFWWSADLVTSDLRFLVIYLSSWTASAGRHFWLVRSNQRFFSSNQLTLMRSTTSWGCKLNCPVGLMARARFLFTSCLLNHSRRPFVPVNRWSLFMTDPGYQDTMPATGRHPNIANSFLILHIIYATSRVSPVKVGHAPFWRPLRGKMELEGLGRYAQLVFKSYEPQDHRKLHATPSCGK